VTEGPDDGEGHSLWDRLRRRKVVQWGIAYAAAAWGFLQGLAYVSGTFDWPREVQQVATLALAVGLPVVLVTAWYHGDQGKQRVTATELIILTLLFLIGGGVFWRYDRAVAPPPASSGPDLAPAASSAVPSGVAERSVAVLPFVNFSNEPDGEYFADGLTEEILNSLAQAGDLKVAGRTSSFAFKGRNEDLRRIGETLGVATVLEGSVRRAGDRVRVTTQLVRVADGFHLWSQTYDRTLNDVFAVQLDIAQNVAGVLEVVIDDAQRQRMRDAGVKNPEAFIAFQKGRALFMKAHKINSNQPMVESLVEANREFARATELEPDIAMAYMLSADLYAHRMDDRDDLPDTERLQAIEHVRRLLEKASQSATDPRLRAFIDLDRQIFSDDWSGLAARAREAAELPGCINGNWSTVLGTYGMADVFGRIESDQRRCDPLDDNGWTRGMIFMSATDGPAAVLDLAKQVPAELGPSRWRYAEQVRALASLGRLDEARAIVSLMSPGNSAQAQAALTVSIAEGRSPAAVQSQLGELLAASPRSLVSATSKVSLTMLVNDYAGDREANNRLAAEVDARPGGTLSLLRIGETCACGAAWDLDRTPNFKKRLTEAGLRWPPRDLRPRSARSG